MVQIFFVRKWAHYSLYLRWRLDIATKLYVSRNLPISNCFVQMLIAMIEYHEITNKSILVLIRQNCEKYLDYLELKVRKT